MQNNLMIKGRERKTRNRHSPEIERKHMKPIQEPIAYLLPNSIPPPTPAAP
jgi:hypothetical protein